MTGIELCFEDSKAIFDYLQQGKKFSDLFVGHDSEFFQYVSVLSSALSLQECIDCVHSIRKGHSGLKSALIKQTLYPFFLIGFSYFLILFFTWTILPVMQMYLQPSVITLVHSLFYVYSVILFGIVALVVIIIYGQNSTKVELALSHYSFQKQMVSYEFSTLYRQLHQHGLTSTQCIEVMERMPFNLSVKMMANQFSSYFKKGISFMDCLYKIHRLDPVFIRFVSIGIKSKEIDSLLHAYEEKTLYELEKKVSSASRVFQLFSYGMVAILIFLFYQILLGPLNMLETF